MIWFFTSQSKKFQLCQDGPSWVEPVLSKDKCILLKDTTQWRRWGISNFWYPTLRPSDNYFCTERLKLHIILFICSYQTFLGKNLHIYKWRICTNCTLTTELSQFMILTLTVKPILSGHLNIDKTKSLKTNGNLMKVESIAEYVWSALSNNWSWKPIFGILFEWRLKTGFTVKSFFKHACAAI